MSVAKVYAKTLYETVRDKSGDGFENLESLSRELKAISETLGSSRDAAILLFGPAVPAKEKEAAIVAIAKAMRCSQALVQFLRLLASKGRLGFLPAIAEAFESVRYESSGGIYGELVSADPLEKEELEGLCQIFKRKLGKEVSFRSSVESSLLAGLKVTVGGVTYDGTLRSQLDRLRAKVAQGAVTGH